MGPGASEELFTFDRWSLATPSSEEMVFLREGGGGKETLILPKLYLDVTGNTSLSKFTRWSVKLE